MLKPLIIFELKLVLKAKWLIAYTGFFFLLTESLYYFNSDSVKVFISLLNIILIVMPLVSVIYGTQYFYNSREFMQFLLAQPLRRRDIFISSFISSFAAVVGSFIVGAGIPLIIHEYSRDMVPVIILLVSGGALSGIFLSIGFFIANLFDDKAKGLGVALISWFFLCFLYDGFLLGVLYFFRDYPIETPALLLSILNPNDLARLLITLKLDVSAMMGYTGAVYKSVLGSDKGLVLAAVMLMIWFVVPAILSMKRFIKKDF